MGPVGTRGNSAWQALFPTSHLKIEILAQNQGVADFQPAGKLKYVEDLKGGHNTDNHPLQADRLKDYFEIACSLTQHKPEGFGPIAARGTQ